ncbi:MAG: hypothetical protein FVQ80_03545 [Planctomycetes bacterium]|nr:hypothetical protein [Planctomycetota bacterium]
MPDKDTKTVCKKRNVEVNLRGDCMLGVRQLSIARRVWVLLCAVSLVFSCSYASYGEQGAGAPGRYRVFTLRNISSGQGRVYLGRLNLGTVSQLPVPNTLLVTAQPQELIKATSLLKLVDSDERYDVKALFAASVAENLPSNREVAEAIGNISIGTFSNPPTGETRNKVIIDLHADSVIIISPSRLTNSIIESLVKLQESSGEPNATPVMRDEALRYETVRDESGEIFNRLLDSIARAEKYQDTEKGFLGLEKSGGHDYEAIKRQDSKPESSTREQKKSLRRESDVNNWEYSPNPAALDNEMLDLDLPERVNITDLLGLVGEYLNLDYMYDSAKIKGDITLKLRGPIKVKDLYPLLESVLKFKGFVMARKGSLVTIVPVSEVLDIDPVLLHDEVGEVQYGDVIVTRVFKLRYVDPGSAQSLLTSMKLGVSVSAMAETSTLIVTGYAYRMPRIEELLDMVDKPSQRQFLFRQLKYTMAKTLAPKIKTLAEQLGTVSVQISATAPAKSKARTRRVPAAAASSSNKPAVYLDADERTNRILMIGTEEELEIVNGLIDSLDVVQRDLRTMRLYEIQHVGAEEVQAKLAELGVVGRGGSRATTRKATATKGRKATATAAATGSPLEALVEEPQIVIVEATNSLLVNATPEQHIQVATIISYVDSETLERAIPYEIYPLENQDPEALAEILQKLIQETVKDKDGKIERTVKKIDEDIVIVPDENTFSIIVYASKKNQEWIKRLITTLDKRRPQVLIDVMLVEITETDIFNYDLDFITRAPVMIAGDPLGLIEGAVFSGRRSSTYSSIGGEGRGFYADQHIEALLTLMQEKGYGRVLAQPRILVNDNETGTIDKKTTLYIARTSQTGRVGDTGGIGADFFSKSVTFDEYTSGIELTITPHISEGDLLRLEVEMTRSSQVPEEGGIGEGDPPPDKKEDNIKTIVTVPDKSTIILGGILQLDQYKGGTKIPILGDIPIIGGLFRTIDKSDRQAKLYIFVRANILRPTATGGGLPELVDISMRKKAAFERGERRFQEYQDWPGIEADPMDPLNILESDD